MITSISQQTPYPSICIMASQDDEVFNRFKTISEYTQILEHCSVNYGFDCLKIIKEENPQLLEEPYLSKFMENDKFGGASVFNYGDLIISPSTIKYIKILSDLINIFGDLTNYKIAEIGGGYGGQCKIIQDYFNIKDYHIIDLSEVNMLSNKYLNKLAVKKFRTSDLDSLNTENYDLVISDYAFTELNREVQDVYNTKIIKGSRNGYMNCNFIYHLMNFPHYNKQELLELNKNIKVIDEKPLSAPDNFIICWKN